MIIEQLYDALKEAGASEDKARDAARAVAEFKQDMNDVRSDLRLLTWMVGFNLAMTAGLLFKAFS